jgi:hypothetical protein
MMWNGRLGALNNCAGAALTVAPSENLHAASCRPPVRP